MALSTNNFIMLGILILGMFGSTQLAFAVPYILTTGTGDGTLTVGVDGYGVFGGLIIGPDSSNAVFQPVGGTAEDTTVHSGVAIRTIDQNNIATIFLSSGNVLGTGLLPTITVTGTPTMGTSSFTHIGLEFELLQTVTLTSSGTTLTQTYTITNPLGNPSIDFSMIRYFDGDLGFANSNTIDGGGRLVLDGTEILFETDEIGTSSEENTFVGITAEGGTESTDRFEISQFANIGGNIVSNIEPVFAVPNIISGDNNLDGFIEGVGYDVTLGLRNDFSLAEGESTVYVTKTVFGSGPPADVEIDPPTKKQLVGGMILPLDTVTLLLAGSQSMTWIIPLVLSIFGIGFILFKRKIR
jgi:hypothetical protein